VIIFPPVSRHNPAKGEKLMETIRTLRQAKIFLREYDRLANFNLQRECEHGHQACSTKRGGPCYDETLCNFPELAEE
jgi:hypothetical protein